MTDRFGILSCRIPSTAVALSLAASLIWIPQSLILADTVAAVCIGTDAELTGLSPIVLASMFALLLVARSVADTGAFSISARTSTAKKMDLRRKLIQAVLPWSPFDATRPPVGEIASLVVDQVETIDPFLVRYQIARFRMAVVPVAILVAILPVSWAVALMLAIAGPVIPVFMALIGATARERSRRQLDEAGNLTGLLLDRLRGLASIRLLGAEERVAAAIEASGERMRRSAMDVLSIAFLSSAVLEFFATVGVAMVALYVGFYLLGWITFGATLTNFGLSGGLFMLLLAPDFFQPLREFAAGYHDRAAVVGLAERTDDIFNVRRPSIVGRLDATAHRHLDRPLASSVDVRRLTVTACRLRAPFAEAREPCGRRRRARSDHGSERRREERLASRYRRSHRRSSGPSCDRRHAPYKRHGGNFTSSNGLDRTGAVCAASLARAKSSTGGPVDRPRARRCCARDSAPDGTGRADAAPDADADRREWCGSLGRGASPSRDRARSASRCTGDSCGRADGGSRRRDGG